MHRKRIMFIEQKTNGKATLDGHGPAWIGEAIFSKSGKRITYKNKTFQRIRGGGAHGNHLCLEDGNEYWISGVKKDGSNRHWSGGGLIEIDKDAAMWIETYSAGHAG